MLNGCMRHYEVPIEVNFQFPNCADCESCLEELDELDFSDMIHIEVDAAVKRSVDAELGVTGGKLF